MSCDYANLSMLKYEYAFGILHGCLGNWCVKSLL